MESISSLDEGIKNEANLIRLIDNKKNRIRASIDQELSLLIEQFGVPTDSSRSVTQNSSHLSGISSKIDSFDNYVQEEFGARPPFHTAQNRYRARKNIFKVNERRAKLGLEWSDGLNQSVQSDLRAMQASQVAIYNTKKSQQQRRAQLGFLRLEVRNRLLEEKARSKQSDEPQSKLKTFSRPTDVDSWRVHTETRVTSLNRRYPRCTLPHRQLNNIRKNRQALQALKNNMSAFLNE